MMTFFQASHITQWEKCQGWKLRNLHKIIVHTYLWFWLRYINLNIKNFIIIKCLLFLFFCTQFFFFRENNIPHCEMQTWWLQRRTRKKLFSSRTFRLSSYANTKWKKCLCYKKLSASVFQWKIIPHFYFLQYRKTSFLIRAVPKTVNFICKCFKMILIVSF